MTHDDVPVGHRSVEHTPDGRWAEASRRCVRVVILGVLLLVAAPVVHFAVLTLAISADDARPSVQAAVRPYDPCEDMSVEFGPVTSAAGGNSGMLAVIPVTVTNISDETIDVSFTAVAQNANDEIINTFRLNIEPLGAGEHTTIEVLREVGPGSFDELATASFDLCEVFVNGRRA